MYDFIPALPVARVVLSCELPKFSVLVASMIMPHRQASRTHPGEHFFLFKSSSVAPKIVFAKMDAYRSLFTRIKLVAELVHNIPVPSTRSRDSPFST